MVLGAMVHTYKAKLNKGKKNDTFGRMKKLGIPQFHREMTSHFNGIKKHGRNE